MPPAITDEMSKDMGKKAFTTPKQYAVCSTILCVIVFLFSGIILYMAGLDSHVAIFLGGITGLIMYLIKERSLHLKEQIQTFDVTVPIMFFLLNWTGSELASSVFGLIAGSFSSMDPGRDQVYDHTMLSVVIGTVIIAPIGEELMFRLCSMGLLKKCSSKMFTIMFPTVIFTLMHAFYSLQGLINVLAGSVFMAICYYYTDNIIYTILVHFLHNLLCVPDFFNSLSTYRSGYSVLRPLPFVIYAVIFAAGMVWFIKVFRKKYDAETGPVQADTDIE